jgi:hypothetical protein
MAPVFEKCNVALLSHVPVGLALCVTRISPRSVPVRTSALDQPQSPDQGFTPLPLRAPFACGAGPICRRWASLLLDKGAAQMRTSKWRGGAWGSHGSSSH